MISACEIMVTSPLKCLSKISINWLLHRVDKLYLFCSWHWATSNLQCGWSCWAIFDVSAIILNPWSERICCMESWQSLFLASHALLAHFAMQVSTLSMLCTFASKQQKKRLFCSLGKALLIGQGAGISRMCFGYKFLHKLELLPCPLPDEWSLQPARCGQHEPNFIKIINQYIWDTKEKKIYS